MKLMECDLVHSVQTVAVTGVLLVGKIVNSFNMKNIEKKSVKIKNVNVYFN